MQSIRGWLPRLIQPRLPVEAGGLSLVSAILQAVVGNRPLTMTAILVYGASVVPELRGLLGMVIGRAEHYSRLINSWRIFSSSSNWLRHRRCCPTHQPLFLPWLRRGAKLEVWDRPDRRRPGLPA